MKRSLLPVSTAAALLGLLPFGAAAQGTPEQRAGAYLSANCANCHGTAGVSATSLPSLAGMPREGFVRAMTEFRDGKRSATIMHQLAKGYSDAQIALMADYFARQPSK